MLVNGMHFEAIWGNIMTYYYEVNSVILSKSVYFILNMIWSEGMHQTYLHHVIF